MAATVPGLSFKPIHQFKTESNVHKKNIYQKLYCLHNGSPAIRSAPHPGSNYNG